MLCCIGLGYSWKSFSQQTTVREKTLGTIEMQYVTVTTNYQNGKDNDDHDVSESTTMDKMDTREMHDVQHLWVSVFRGGGVPFSDSL